MSEKRMVYAEDVIQRIRDMAPEILGGWYNPYMRNICRDEYQKEAARLDRIGDIVPLLRQMAGIAGFEIIGRIPLRDKATGKEYR